MNLFWALTLAACASPAPSAGFIVLTSVPTVSPTRVKPTGIPPRPTYQPGELVDYIVQDGDTLPVLAIHFNTTEERIRKANSALPQELTTLPPGMPMKIPIYYRPLWGSSFQILPDSLFVYGPAQVGFDTRAFVGKQGGWFKAYQEYAYGGARSAAEIVDTIAAQYSLSPRLLLALLDFQGGAFSLGQPSNPDYMLGYRDYQNKGLYGQLNWAANQLNNGFYAWRQGQLTSFDHLDGRMERPDPWQNAATVALQVYFTKLVDYNTYVEATGENGFIKTYQALFGDPWSAGETRAYLPGSLKQPDFALPFPIGKTWSYTGGPHAGWGDGEPLAAVDFAPPVSGCNLSDDWATAIADGVIVRVETGLAVLDLDGDGDERTGWVVIYLHLAANGKVGLGTRLKAGDPMGRPSCEGGHATGSHIHIARKYNGEWITAGGIIPFTFEGWVVQNGDESYLGYLKRGSRTLRACTCSDQLSHIRAGDPN